MGGFVGIVLSSLIFSSSDTLKREINNLKNRNNELMNRLREVTEKMLYYKAIAQKYEDLMKK
jgi:prefoldin subunit 5